MVLSMLTTWAFIGRGNKSNVLMIVVIALSLIFAFCDEIFQIKIPGRGFQVSDLIFDTLGIIAGNALYFTARRCFDARNQW